MTNALNIASHGKAGRVSALSIGSVGRLIVSVVYVPVIRAVTEIIRLTSGITTQLRLQSKLW